MKTLMLKLSILSLCASSLAACSQTVQPSCAGWEKITVKPATAVYLAGNDLVAGQGIASHNKHGRNAGCWK
jgi:hypothetical protein